MKAILFNTEMVQAILDGRKTTTRRIVKTIWGRQKLYNVVTELNGDKNIYAGFYDNSDIFEHEGEKLVDAVYAKSKYNPGDVLYVRETWKVEHTYGDELADIRFKANNEIEHLTGLKEETYDKLIDFESKNGWQPSIFMPKEAARIFLRVKDIRVERLQDIDDNGCFGEGVSPWDDRCYENNGWTPNLNDPDSGGNCEPKNAFIAIWNSTVNKKDLDKYGWDSNPYVWVIEFERINKDEALKESN